MATSNVFTKVVRERIQNSTPDKWIAFLLSVLGTLWLLISVVGEHWVVVTFYEDITRTWDWGLWNTCHAISTFITVCVQPDWLGLCLVFSMMSLAFSLCAVFCGLYGLKCTDIKLRRNIMYKAAVVFLSLVVVVELVVVITFPVKFRENIMTSEVVKRWDFDWSYGFAWGGIIFSLSSALFYCMTRWGAGLLRETKNVPNV